MKWNAHHCNIIIMTVTPLWGLLGGLHTRVKFVLYRSPDLSLADWAVFSINARLMEDQTSSEGRWTWMTKIIFSKLFRIPKSGQLGVKIKHYGLSSPTHKFQMLNVEIFLKREVCPLHWSRSLCLFCVKNHYGCMYFYIMVVCISNGCMYLY